MKRSIDPRQHRVRTYALPRIAEKEWQVNRLLPVLATLWLLVGCGEIRNTSRLSQPIDERLVAGVGDAIIEIATNESLPNLFGNADLFGRTRPTGKVIVTYLGIEQGRAIIERHTIRMQSTATTMNSTPIFIPQTSTTAYSGVATFSGMAPSGGVMGSTVSSGSATTTAPPIILPPSGSETQVISNDRIRVYLNLANDRRLIVEGREIIIEEATPAMVAYRIRGLSAGAQ